MKKIIFAFSVGLLLASCGSNSEKTVIRIDSETLMHEVRATPSPLDGEHVTVNPPRFMWPDKFPHLGTVLDGVPGHVDEKPAVRYRIRISQDKSFKKDVLTGEREWAFFNPFQCLVSGRWYWQHAYVDKDGKEEWSPVYTFYIDKETPTFNPPALDKVLANYSNRHPRVLLDANEWDAIIERNLNNLEAQGYVKKSNRCLTQSLKPLHEEIDTTIVVKLTDKVKRKSALIRESRKIVDREEANVEALVRAYLLTKDKKYCREGMKRLSEILSWQESPYFAGDFNLSTLLSMCTSAYDGFFVELSAEQRLMLLNHIRNIGDKFYHEYVNHLENRIADNHVWQMTFRILTMAAFATVGELSEASVWTDYCYNEWISRMPGLNADGAWHNGDSYFHVNIRTLIEVPAFLSRISGFHFFADPWYANNVLYVIYQQPPFSKSGGFGNSHETKHTPSGARVGYADALARELDNPWAAAYVHEILREDPDIMSRSFETKPSDLTWYRCVTTKPLPPYTKPLAELPPCKVFPQTGTALMHTDIGHHGSNAMLSFRSSPYGSTSHALANQNAFNTFYGGKAIFYSSGHRTGFTDDHCMYAYRNTRAHNSILADGMGQKIGTEGYGWIPRYYQGKEISYVVGDASNAYGLVTSPLWLERGRLSGTQYTPENGWDTNRVDLYRRHIVQLGNSGIYVVFDELQGINSVAWSYLLHTVELPMEVNEADGSLCVRGTNRAGGVSVAHLYSSVPMTWCQTDTFFVEANDWKGRLGSKTLPNHYHFRATTVPVERTCFLNIIDVHGNNRPDIEVNRSGNMFSIVGWNIECDVEHPECAGLRIERADDSGVSLYYHPDGSTIVNDIDSCGHRVEHRLCDSLPRLDI